jgi:bacteriocin biosynthesis cyclodehydratase domain-containing protein
MNRTATPWLKPWYTRVYSSSREVAFVSGDHCVRLEGAAVQPLIRPLLSLLDGYRTLAEVIEQLGEPVAPAVARVLDTLDGQGLLLSSGVADDLVTRGAADTARLLVAAFGRAETLELQPLARAIADSRVGVVGTSPVAFDAVDILVRSGVLATHLNGFVEPAESERLDALVAAPSSLGEASALREVNQWALRRGMPWMPLLPFNGTHAAIGPLFVPPVTCCYQCFLMRRWTVDDAEALVGASSDIEEGIALHHPAVDAAVAGLATTLLLRWLVLQDPFAVGRLFSFTLGRELDVRGHRVLRMPRCPDCSVSGVGASPIASWFEREFESDDRQ